MIILPLTSMQLLSYADFQNIQLLLESNITLITLITGILMLYYREQIIVQTVKPISRGAENRFKQIC